MNKFFCPVLTALLALAACGKEPAPAPTPQPEAPPSAAAATETPAPAPAAPAQPVGENDGESVDAGVSTTTPVAAAVEAATPAPPSGDLARWKQGTHFTAYPVAQPVSTPPGKVEVIEGFWYGCAHCYALEPRVEAWEKTKPDWVTLKRLPVIWNEVTREDARLFITIESLGLLDKLHGEVFRDRYPRPARGPGGDREARPRVPGVARRIRRRLREALPVVLHREPLAPDGEPLAALHAGPHADGGRSGQVPD
jgi:hypothetical protein